MTTLKELGEFGLISRFEKMLHQKLPDGVVGIGDDCAVIPQTSERSLLVTTDMLTEGAHFIFDKISAHDLGHKAIAVNLSDIAAMGGKPTAIFLSLALPRTIEVTWLDEFFAGLTVTAERFGVLVLGGDTTRSESGLTISITAIGDAHPDQVKLRSAAKEGQIIAVTGSLGNSAAGLEALLKNSRSDHELLRAHLHPEPQVSEGEWLGRQQSVGAMMDLSDGLASDLPKILEASKVGADIEIENLPASKELSANTIGVDAVECALVGGEDYRLLITVKAAEFEKTARDFEAKFGSPMTAIGKVTASGLHYLRNGKPYKIKAQPFAHF